MPLREVLPDELLVSGMVSIRMPSVEEVPKDPKKSPKKSHKCVKVGVLNQGLL